MNWPKGVRNSLGVRNMPLLILIFNFAQGLKKTHIIGYRVSEIHWVSETCYFLTGEKKKDVRIFLGVPEVLKHILNTSNF